MNWYILNKIKLDVWYRGNKSIYPTKVTDNEIIMSNKDKLSIINDEFKINKILFSNLPDITEEEMYDMYIEFLIKKGYKILN